jgi:type II restriction/modification system DNA methylase subunit YeeA
MRGELGDSYVVTLRRTYAGRVPGGADFVTYWFEKARAQIAADLTQAAGLVATNSIRGGANRKVLERIVDTTRIFEAWSDEPWVNEGAAVRVSLVGFGPFFGVDRSSRLDGRPVVKIHADLTAAQGMDLTQAKQLAENEGSTFFGLCLAGDFRISGEVARSWLMLPNPNSRPNSDVVRPIYNGSDVTGRWADRWVIDFGTAMSEAEASLYEVPFQYLVSSVQPIRAKNARKSRATYWWRHGETRPGLRTRLSGLSRYIATVETAKHRFFVWFPVAVAPEHKLVVIPSDSEICFGILSSRMHVVWAVRVGGRLGVGNDPVYTTSVCFDKYPFPAGLTPRDTAPVAGQASPPCLAGEIVAANIAAAARRLNELREAWLNPAEWVDWVITPEEEKAGFPKRPVAKPGHEADLRKRTLTNLYNARPAWLDFAHKALDNAVAAAYGWSDYTPEMPDDEILRRLLALNLERSKS